MTRQGWAEKKARKAWHSHRGGLTGYAAKLLLAEHARAVRVVNQLERAAKLHVYLRNHDTRTGYLEAVADMRRAIEKGRR